MKPLPERKSSLWGEEYNVAPMLLDGKIGDGKRFMWFEFMDDRPWYYVVRADFKTKEGTEKFYKMIEEIQELISDEAMSMMSDEQYEEYEVEGWPSETRDFPIPPDMPCGSSWGKYTPSKYDAAVINGLARS